MEQYIVGIMLLLCIRGVVCRQGPMHISTHRLAPQLFYMTCGLMTVTMFWPLANEQLTYPTIFGVLFGSYLLLTFRQWRNGPPAYTLKFNSTAGNR